MHEKVIECCAANGLEIVSEARKGPQKRPEANCQNNVGCRTEETRLAGNPIKIAVQIRRGLCMGVGDVNRPAINNARNLLSK